MFHLSESRTLGAYGDAVLQVFEERRYQQYDREWKKGIGEQSTYEDQNGLYDGAEDLQRYDLSFHKFRLGIQRLGQDAVCRSTQSHRLGHLQSLDDTQLSFAASAVSKISI